MERKEVSGVNLKEKPIPRHVAIIMDGNGRWAKLHGKPRGEGHKAGMKTVRRMLEVAAELNIEYVTMYAFSTENWNRPQDEVKGLMNLMLVSISEELSTLIENGVRLQIIGDVKRLPEEVRAGLYNCIEKTKDNNGPTLVLALSYSSRWELLEAVKSIANDVREGILSLESLNEDVFINYLDTKHIPDPDLLIRTSGELRISNFLLWQLAYTELYFTDVLWPDFSKENFKEAICEYQQRERRLGLTSEQIAGKNN